MERSGICIRVNLPCWVSHNSILDILKAQQPTLPLFLGSFPIDLYKRVILTVIYIEGPQTAETKRVMAIDFFDPLSSIVKFHFVR